MKYYNSLKEIMRFEFTNGSFENENHMFKLFYIKLYLKILDIL